MELLTVQEAARELRVSPVTVRRYIKSGRLRCLRIGRSVRLRREDLHGLGEDAGGESPAEGFAPQLLEKLIAIGDSKSAARLGGKCDELTGAFAEKQARDRWIVDAALAGEKLDYKSL